MIELDRSVYGILVADVTGHGIHAALLSFMSAMGFKNVASRYRSPEKVLRAVNETLYGKLHGGNFVAMFYAIVDTKAQTLAYTQAGNPPALLVQRRTAEVIPLETASTVIGVLPTVRLEEKKTVIESGDKVLFYTDAIVESSSPEGEMLGVDGLRSFLAQHIDLPIEVLLEKVYALGLQHGGPDGQFAFFFSKVQKNCAPTAKIEQKNMQSLKHQSFDEDKQMQKAKH